MRIKISTGGPNHLRNPNVDWGIILKWIVKRYEMMWTKLMA
jgi:hypothetical protein